MEKEVKNIVELFSRYLLILVFGLGNLFIIYKIFTPLTTRVVALVLKLTFFSYAVIISNNSIFVNLKLIELIPACIAGSAYYFLLILVFSVPNINFLKRIKILLFAFGVFFAANVIRIVLLIKFEYTSYFTTIHLISWYLISTILIVGIWLLSIKIFKIKDIPIYSDVKSLYRLTKKKVKKSKRRR